MSRMRLPQTSESRLGRNMAALVLFSLASWLILAFSRYQSMWSPGWRGGGTAELNRTPTDSSRPLKFWSPTRSQPLAFIGVQTSFNYYSFRREDLRRTWFPEDLAAMKRVEQEFGFIMRFVAGRTPNPEHELALQQEIEEFGPFLRLPIDDTYAALPWKTHAFVVTAFRLYNPKFVVKVDDDVYLRLDRLHLALAQYEERKFGYVGCMRRGHMESRPGELNYEPDNAIFGSREYHTFASGPLYVLANSAAKILSSVEPKWLRHLANEDTMMGAWMLSFNVTHFDDRRLCMRQCLSVTIGTAPTHDVGRPTVSSFHLECSGSLTLPRNVTQLPILPPLIDFSPSDTDGLPVHVPRRPAQFLSFASPNARKGMIRSGRWKSVGGKPQWVWNSRPPALSDNHQSATLDRVGAPSDAHAQLAGRRNDGTVRSSSPSTGRMAIMSDEKGIATTREKVLQSVRAIKAGVRAKEGDVA